MQGELVKRYRNQDFLKALGQRCRRLRTTRGYSIDRVAKEADRLSPSVIHRLETGQGAVTISALVRYADVLEVPLRELFDFPMKCYERFPDGPPSVLPYDHSRASGEAFKTLLPFYTWNRAIEALVQRSESALPEGWVEVRPTGTLDRAMFVVEAGLAACVEDAEEGDWLVMRATSAATDGVLPAELVCTLYSKSWKSEV